MPWIYIKRGRTWLVLLTVVIALIGAWVAADGEPHWPLVVH